MYRYFVAVFLSLLLISCGEGNVKNQELDKVQDDGNALRVTLDDILFDFNKVSLKSRGMSILDGIVRVMKQNPNYVVDIVGHSDDIGTRRAKQKISDGRARSVANYLVRNGIKRSRISARGVSDNDSMSSRQKSRRVELRLSER